MFNLFLEWGGALIGLFGAALLASQVSFSRWGWAAFLLANWFFIAWALRIDAFGLLLQQVGFMLTSLVGLYRSGLWPKLTYDKKNTDQPRGGPG